MNIEINLQNLKYENLTTSQKIAFDCLYKTLKSLNSKEEVHWWCMRYASMLPSFNVKFNLEESNE